jgi:hypothetical protein
MDDKDKRQDVPPSHPRDGNPYKAGDDLSYYLGPEATHATAEQCTDLYRIVMEAARATAFDDVASPDVTGPA